MESGRPVTPAEIVRLLGGRARRAQLLEHTPRRRLDAACADGTVVRAARGVYVLPGLPPPHLAAARARGVLSHLSAAQQLGIPMLFDPVRVEVSLPHGSRPQAQDGVRYHWRTLAAGEVENGVTTAVRTVIDCAGALPFAEALALTDAARRQGFVDAATLRLAARQAAGPGSAQARRVVAASSRLAESPLESAVRAVFLDAGLAGFECQVTIWTAGGPVRVDLADRRRRIAVEADSFAHHGATRNAFTQDCRRYDELVRAGWTVLRFTWEQVMLEPEWVQQVVRDVVDRTPVRHGTRKRRG